jgi:hypothetical protein
MPACSNGSGLTGIAIGPAPGQAIIIENHSGAFQPAPVRRKYQSLSRSRAQAVACFLP